MSRQTKNHEPRLLCVTKTALTLLYVVYYLGREAIAIRRGIAEKPLMM
ncbi:hypothetical protein [[Limnothrix rosea] IAM M-220]|nr:hypothetical protein [[Limnothrix rosea] IAM M-220]